MKTSNIWILTVVALSLACFTIGCQDSGTNQVSKDHGHSHGEDGHSDEEDGHSHEEEGHSHGAGPHDGTLADWGGGDYHVEFTVDHDKQEATVYVLGDDAKSPSPIQSEEIQLSIVDPAIDVALTASPQEGDPEGAASRFVGNHEDLGIVQEYEGTISGVIDGTPYSGNFKEVAHDH